MVLSRDLMVLTTACFIQFRGTHNHDRVIITSWFAIHQSLRTRGLLATHHANGMQLRYMFSLGHQLRHGAEGLTAKISIQSSHKYAYSIGGQFLCHVDNIRIEELRLVDGYNS